MDNIVFKTRGTCSRQISVSIDDGIVKNVMFNSGCEGSLQGISKLVEGMPVEHVISKLKGIDCQGRGTSCPDQLAKAIEDAMQKAI
ncbi:MAG: TIGR03905 family TSCPD domain-containing protein [Ruminiclostridium sp.]